ncbi:hypothetical protein IWX76_002194 [Pedobacter sp. CAN_A7]
MAIDSLNEIKLPLTYLKIFFISSYSTDIHSAKHAKSRKTFDRAYTCVHIESKLSPSCNQVFFKKNMDLLYIIIVENFDLGIDIV